MQTKTLTKSFAIANRLGLHALAANRLVQIASRFSAEVSVEKDGHRADGKKIIELLMLLADKGSQVTITSTGADASQALEAIGDLILRGFGEEDPVLLRAPARAAQASGSSA